MRRSRARRDLRRSPRQSLSSGHLRVFRRPTERVPQTRRGCHPEACQRRIFDTARAPPFPRRRPCDSGAMTERPPTIRPGTRDDAPGVVALIGQVFVEYGWIWDPPTEVPDLLDFDAHYAAPRGAFWVVTDGGRVVGSVGVDQPRADIPELPRLYLRPG